MKKYSTLTALALATTLLTVTLQAKEEHQHTIEHKKPENHAKHWAYLGEVGPKHWSELKGKFKMCSEGKQQSPINIIPNKHIQLKSLDLEYKADSKSIIDNGHTVQVNIKEGSLFKIDGVDYKLKQFHFHVPSENNINGNEFPMEAHFVHATDDGKLAVVAVMFEKSDEENPVIAKIWEKLPNLKVGKEEKLEISNKDIQALMPQNKEYYKFEGSLTTPPCSEHVKWHVFKHPLTVSKAQVIDFFKLYGFPNNRPIQATNKREIDD